MPKCCPPTTVSCEERDENHREPSPCGWWWVIKHFSSKTLQDPLCCSCSVRPNTVMKKDNTWGQHSSSLFWIKESNYRTRSTLCGRLYSMTFLRAHYALRTDKCCVSRSTSILEALRKTHLRKASSDSHCGSNFANDRTLKKKALVQSRWELLFI